MTVPFSAPLFKGATRPPCFFGVPVKPFFCVTGSVFLLALWTSMPAALLSVPAVLVMREITRDDDQKFRVLALFFRFRLLPRLKAADRTGIRFSPLSYRTTGFFKGHAP